MVGRCVDRLSSLLDDILIRIISRLPLRIAIVTGCLSSRWRGLWKKVTSIDITTRESDTESEFFTTFSSIVSQFKSPFIRSLTLNFGVVGIVGDRLFLDTWDISWLRIICDRNLYQLKLTRTYWQQFRIILPSFVFQTSSLVSIELEPGIEWQLPESIILPNLKSLSLTFWDGQCEDVAKLIQACPILEELLITSTSNYFWRVILRVSNPKLMRLTMNLGLSEKDIVVISAPKLEYLDISVPSSMQLNFEEEPLGLREATIKLNYYYNRAIEFNGPIADVRLLTLDEVYFIPMDTPSVFHNATRVTLITRMIYSIETLLGLMKLCPSLDDLCLKYVDVDSSDEKSSVLWNGTLLRGLKRITIETIVSIYYKPLKSCLKLAEYLLSNAVNLKHLVFRVNVYDRDKKWDAQSNTRHELNFCKFFYYCPTVPVECEVEFRGVFLKMSRKLGPKAWRTNGKVIAFNNSTWNGFVLEEH